MPDGSGALDSLSSLWNVPVLSGRIREADDLPRLSRRALGWGLAGCLAFGAALGSYGGGAAQIVAAALKMPLLLLGTAALCFPVLFVLQILRAPHPMSLGAAVTVQLVSLSATAVVWGSFAPPLLFLVVSTHHYRLAQLLSLGVGAAGGFAGLGRFMKLHVPLTGTGGVPGYLALYLVLFAMVGGQLAWVLRPFVGDPGLPFQLFRESGGDMLSHVFGLLSR